MAKEIFISYRRDDSAGTTGRIYDRLVSAFPRDRIFMDVDSEMHGLDFARVLDEKIAASDLVAVVIGPNWLTATSAKGGRRIDNPDDFVRVEVSAALARNIPVIPILVDGSGMPSESELPEELKPLARRHAVELRNTRFADDAATLVKVVSKRLYDEGPRVLRLSALTATLLLLFGLVFLGFQMRWIEPDVILLEDFAKGDSSSTGQSSAATTPGATLRQEQMARELQELEERLARAEEEAEAADRERVRRAEAEAEEERRRRKRAEEEAEAARERRERLRQLELEAEMRRLRRERDEQERARREEERRRQAEAERRRAEQAEAERLRAEQERQQLKSALSVCERLWRQRNGIFHEFGYCFTKAKGQRVFGNAGCFRNMDSAWRAMGSRNRATVKSIQNQERANGC